VFEQRAWHGGMKLMVTSPMEFIQVPIEWPVCGRRQQFKDVKAPYEGKTLATTAIGAEDMEAAAGAAFWISDTPEDMAARLVELTRHPIACLVIAGRLRVRQPGLQPAGGIRRAARVHGPGGRTPPLDRTAARSGRLSARARAGVLNGGTRAQVP
jgi:hypothetical protein